jgi:acyl-coenzyme A synthetase/AMP-(fatty) acid ligase
MRAKPKRVYTYRDLIELFETSPSVTRRASRCAIERRTERTVHLRDLRELATRVAGLPREPRHQQGDRVMLVSSNAPEWGMTYLRRA